MSRWLVLGGTQFLSREVAAAAVARGHEVVCAARGRSGPVPEGARLVRVDRDDEDGLAPLRGERFDAVVDTAIISYRWVREALAEFADTAGHWTFVSTMNVYSDLSRRGGGVDDPLLEPRYADPEGPEDFGAYGSIKVASEKAVVETVGDRALVVRPGLVCGPGDPYDRFGYWPARFSRGGRALVPDAPDQPCQLIDVRDLAEWIVLSGERGLTGTFDASGPRTTLGSVLEGIADAVGASDLEPVPVSPDRLFEAGVMPWQGPHSLPLWLPESHHGVVDRDTAPALEAGLSVRPLAETAEATLAYEKEAGLDRERQAGLTSVEETELLERIDTAVP
ncbi:NAD-dependent epimerase/dehydratase family protein [Nocardiopsis sp. LDBS1602]|uniref:NAD-dependent epimerase/dehydratase family protein n=1 Tax=Nocardiopsis sp. LDBS1602 TaxID=3109597 RepID=UPI002DBDA469|nr:NAD-dependent epimerase/dehydratase family protein [Nocardiopsis sp. LDBS1602]MEC3893367.1 NAD-dependent epimerase/dehydratase family protein [Nocardiopsis sp. LDBS1602]